MAKNLTLEDFRAARERITPYVHRTPCLPFQELSEELGQEIWIKMENLQATGGFKLRGNINKLLSVGRDNLAGGVVTASSGNHGLGLSYSARLMEIRATVVVPRSTPSNKVEKLRRYGARVILEGEHYDQAVVRAQKISRESGALYVPSFDDPQIIAGNGSMGLEIYEDVPSCALYICPIGGGGGISGSGLALKKLNPDLHIIGVEAAGAASMKASLAKGAATTIDRVETAAEGIAVSRPGDLPFNIVRDLVEDVVTVSEGEMENALRYLVGRGKVVPELAGTATTAALLSGKVVPEKGPVVILLSGGNIDPQVLAAHLGQE